MEPLSIIASTVTLLEVTDKAVKCLKRFRSFKESHLVLTALLNSITDLQALLAVIRDSVESLNASNVPVSIDIYRSLPQFVESTHRHLEALLNFIQHEILKDPGRVSFSNWTPKTQRKLVELKNSILESHTLLHSAVASANLRVLPELVHAVQEVKIAHEYHNTRTSGTLEQIAAKLTSEPIPTQSASKVSASHSVARRMPNLFTLSDPSLSTSRLCVNMIIPNQRCEVLCACQCHIRSRFSTQGWIATALGSLFLNYYATPNLEVRPCNTPRCRRSSPSSSTRLTYYFPTWMMRKALAFSSWNQFSGGGAKWVIETPREIPEDRPCWNFIQSGDSAAVQDLLKRRMMSPYDIDRGGRSVLNYAQRYWQVDICALLSARGANWHLKDRHGVSAADGIWLKLLHKGNKDEKTSGFWKLVVLSEDEYDLQLTPIHRIVVGLSGVPLQSQLESDASAINDPDWQDRTPLMWAALRDDCANVQILLSEGADVSRYDREGRTALQMATIGGCQKCVFDILQAGADPNFRDSWGHTAMHFAAGSQDVAEADQMIRALKEHGARLDALDNDGWTPLYDAVHRNSLSAVSLLIRHGAAMNTCNYQNETPISRAVFMNHVEILEILCQNGPQFMWQSRQGQPVNILEYAALHGSVEAMGIIATTPADPVEYDPQELDRLFNEERLKSWRSWNKQTLGQAERDAFKNLLVKIGKPTARGRSLSDGSISYDKESEENELEVFEDALERIESPAMAQETSVTAESQLGQSEG